LIRAQLIGLEEFKLAFDTASKQMKQRVDDATRETAQIFATKAYSEVIGQDSVFTFELAKSIRVEPEGFASYSVVAKAPYAGFVEFGTKKRYKPQVGYDSVAALFKGQKPVNKYGSLFDAIYAWVKKKNIGKKENKRQTKNEKKDIAWAITMDIAKNGRKAKPFFFKNVVPVSVILQRRLKDIFNAF
jgi:HK97 gp10 family phage protein